MPIVDIPNRPGGSEVRHISQIIEDFDAILAVVNGGLDEENFSSDGFIGPAALTGPLAGTLGVSIVGTPRRGFDLEPGSIALTSPSYTISGGPGPVFVNQPVGGLTMVYAEAFCSIPAGGSYYLGLYIDTGAIQTHTIARGSEATPQRRSTGPVRDGAFGNEVDGRGTWWIFDLAGAHNYQMVYAATPGTGNFSDRKLYVVTQGGE